MGLFLLKDPFGSFQQQPVSVACSGYCPLDLLTACGERQQRANIGVAIVPELQYEIVTTVLSFFFDLSDQQPGKRVEKEKPFQCRDCQVQQVIVAPDMGKFMDQDSFDLLRGKMIDHRHRQKNNRFQVAQGEGNVDLRR